MQISILLMQEIIKLFVIMFMGYAVVKAGLMKASESKSVSVILVYLVNPCVIVNAFQVEYTPEVQKGLILAGDGSRGHPFVVFAAYGNIETSTPSECDRTCNRDLFQCGYSGHSVGAGVAWTGICHLFQCIHYGTAGAFMDTL